MTSGFPLSARVLRIVPGAMTKPLAVLALAVLLGGCHKLTGEELCDIKGASAGGMKLTGYVGDEPTCAATTNPLGCDSADDICHQREKCQLPLFKRYVERGVVIGGYRILPEARQRAAEEAQLAGTHACEAEELTARRTRSENERTAKAIKQAEDLLREINAEKRTRR